MLQEISLLTPYETPCGTPYGKLESSFPGGCMLLSWFSCVVPLVFLMGFLSVLAGWARARARFGLGMGPVWAQAQCEAHVHE